MTTWLVGHNDDVVWSRDGNEPYDLDPSNTLAVFAYYAISAQTGAAIHHDNYAGFRDDPNGNHDGFQATRCAFWSDLAAKSSADARRYLFHIIDSQAPLTKESNTRSHDFDSR